MTRSGNGTLATLGAAIGILLTIVLMIGHATAEEPSRGLYLRQIAAYPSPALSAVSSREYKFLIDAAETRSTAGAGFSDLWSQLKTAAARGGFRITERKRDALNVEKFTREYFDTRDQALWQKGYLIRVTDRARDGRSPSVTSITVKKIGDDPVRTLAAPLRVTEAGKAKIVAEDNVSFGAGDELGGSIEKGVSFSVALASGDELTLADFGRYVPELFDLGLAAGSTLVATRVFCERIKPGKVSFPGVGPSTLSIEAWSTAAGQAPYLYELSFRYSDIDFYAAGETHAAAERFMTDAIGQLRHLAGRENAKWAGSKVRRLMNRPAVSHPAVGHPAVGQ